MSLIVRTLITAAFTATATIAAPAAAGSFVTGGGFKIYKAQLGITGGDNAQCPVHKTAKGWVYMSHKATVQVMIFRKGKTIPTPVSITSVKASNGQYVAEITQQMVFFSPTNSEYRMLVGGVNGGKGVASNWVPVNISC